MVNVWIICLSVYLYCESFTIKMLPVCTRNSRDALFWPHTHVAGSVLGSMTSLFSLFLMHQAIAAVLSSDFSFYKVIIITRKSKSNFENQISLMSSANLNRPFIKWFGSFVNWLDGVCGTTFIDCRMMTLSKWLPNSCARLLFLQTQSLWQMRHFSLIFIDWSEVSQQIIINVITHHASSSWMIMIVVVSHQSLAHSAYYQLWLLRSLYLCRFICWPV